MIKKPCPKGNTTKFPKMECDVHALVRAASSEHCAKLFLASGRLQGPVPPQVITAGIQCVVLLAEFCCLSPSVIMQPCGRWLLERNTHQTDVARVMLNTHFGPADLEWLGDRALSFFTELVMRAPHFADVRHVYAVALQLRSLPADVHAAVEAYVNFAYPATACSSDCTICLEVINAGKSCLLECAHSFHEECLAQWGPGTCPLCRAPVKKSPVCASPFVHLPAEQPRHASERMRDLFMNGRHDDVYRLESTSYAFRMPQLLRSWQAHRVNPNPPPRARGRSYQLHRFIQSMPMEPEMTSLDPSFPLPLAGTLRDEIVSIRLYDSELELDPRLEYPAVEAALTSSEISERDIELVMSQTAVGRERALAALTAENGDLVSAIMLILLV